MKHSKVFLACAILLTALMAAGQAGAAWYTIDTPLKPQDGSTAAKLDGFLRYKRSDSPLVGLGQAWVDAANKYGINQVYLMSHAILESGWGTSAIATDKHNIYGYQAYDSSPYASAMSFSSFQACVDYVAGKINGNYLTPGGPYYNGATLRGMNVKYATDPLWGAKIANIMNMFADPIGAYPAQTPPSGLPGISASDALALYDYAGGTSGFWNFRATGGGAKPGVAPYSAWRSCPGGLGADQLKLVKGDFNGDGITDVLGLFAYDRGISGFWLWKGKANGAFDNPVRLFFSSGWDASATKLVTGDFDGDGQDEVMAFYSYGGTSTSVYLFKLGSSGTFDYPKKIFYSSGWDLSRTTLLSTESTGRAEVVAAYKYAGPTETGMWRFGLDANGNLIYPQTVFHSGNWDYDRTAFLAGDVDGDGNGDVMAVYNYGGTRTGVFAFYRAGDTFRYPKMTFFSPYWSYEQSSFLASDFNKDGRADVVAFYDYGGGQTAAWFFAGAGDSMAYPVRIYDTPYWNNASTRWIQRW